MTKEEFAKGMKFISLAYDKDMTKNQIEVWYEFFIDVDFKKFRIAVKRIINKTKYFPSIAEIKEELADLEMSKQNINPELEWEEVRNAIRNYDIYDGEKAMATLKPLTKQIVLMVGGWYTLCTTEDIKWRKKEFIDLYNRELNKVKNIEKVGNNKLNHEIEYLKQIEFEEQEIERQNLIELQN